MNYGVYNVALFENLVYVQYPVVYILIACDVCAISCDIMLFDILKSIITYILLCIFENIVVYVQ